MVGCASVFSRKVSLDTSSRGWEFFMEKGPYLQVLASERGEGRKPLCRLSATCPV